MTRILVLAALLAIVAAIYAPVADYPFVALDDDIYVRDNPFIPEGFSWKGIAWALTADLTWNSRNADYWQPLTLLSRLLDGQLFGLWAGGHHLVNLALHLLNAALLTLFLEQLLARGAGGGRHAETRTASDRLLIAASVAAIWALHPLAVGTVAWVTDRKNLLATAFALLALLVHCRRAHPPVSRWAAGVLPLFVLALMSKPAIAPMAAIFAILDLRLLGDASGSTTETRSDDGPRLGSVLSLVGHRPVLHFLAALPLVILILANTARFQPQAFGDIPIGLRLARIPVAIGLYLKGWFLPERFASFYPSPWSHESAHVAGAALLLVVLLLLAWRLRRAFPDLLVGMAWFLVCLSPVLGLTHELWATRFTYPAVIGLTIPIAAGAYRLRRPGSRRLLIGGFLILALSLGLESRRQLPAWSSSEALFRTAIEVTGPNHFMERNLGVLAVEAGRFAEAESHFFAAIALRPGYAAHRFNLGVLRDKEGRETEALAAYAEAIERDPTNLGALFNRGTMHLNSGRIEAAENDLRSAIAAAPGDPETLNNLGVVRSRQERWREALELFARSWPHHPRPATPSLGAAGACLAMGRFEEASVWLERAIEADPANEMARRNLEQLRRRGRPGPAGQRPSS